MIIGPSNPPLAAPSPTAPGPAVSPVQLACSDFLSCPQHRPLVYGLSCMLQVGKGLVAPCLWGCNHSVYSHACCLCVCPHLCHGREQLCWQERPSLRSAMEFLVAVRLCAASRHQWTCSFMPDPVCLCWVQLHRRPLRISLLPPACSGCLVPVQTGQVLSGLQAVGCITNFCSF